MRVTVPEGHIAVIIPDQLAAEIASYCRIERRRLTKLKVVPPSYGVLSDLQLAVQDGIDS